jgi:hypothetical protein
MFTANCAMQYERVLANVIHYSINIFSINSPLLYDIFSRNKPEEILDRSN